MFRFSSALFFLSAGCAQAAGLFLETEFFANKGGWVIDTQSIEQMGSPYLLAHGCGAPVADASTPVTLPGSGTWKVWARTRDWTPDFDGVKPGRFRIAVDGQYLPAELGVAPAAWDWVEAGTFTAASPGVTVALHDLTGFDGRCDALYFTDDLSAQPSAWRELQFQDASPLPVSIFDFVVVGGGIAGTGAAIAAAEQGLSVALIQDRPMLGGNASNEIRVKTEGTSRNNPIVLAIKNESSNTIDASSYDARRMAKAAQYPTLTLFTGYHAYGVVTNSSGAITAVDARRTDSPERIRFEAPLFADCTGDGSVGVWAGARFFMGREAKSTYNESLAPAAADSQVMGSSLMWRTKTGSEPSTFPEVPWALTVAKTSALTGGNWQWEYGMHLDTVAHAEEIRDHLLRAIYGNFYNAKQKPENANREFEWVPYIAGKRESRRLLGDYIVTENDVRSKKYFEDAVGSANWSIDLHFTTATSYLSDTTHHQVGEWYFPYRSLCSADVPNLFIAGRHASFSRVASGSSRVMNTTGQMGVAVGYAASLCKKYACSPRDIYRSKAKTTELQFLIGGVWPQRPSTLNEESAVAVDNLEAHVSGTWVTSDWEKGRFGANYLHNNKIASDDRWVKYTPALPRTGVYTLQQIWNGTSDRAPSVPVEIAYADGIRTNYVNMSQNSGVWNTVATGLRFSQGTTGSAKIITKGTTGYVMADAFRWIPMPDDIIIDNLDPAGVEISGNWIATQATSKGYGGTALKNAASSAGTWVRFTATPARTGAYTVKIHRLSASGSKIVPVEITHADGRTIVNADLSGENNATWMTLGTWSFKAGQPAGVRILTEGCAVSYVFADAVWLSFTDEFDRDGNGLPDDWERHHFLTEGGTDPDADADGDGLCNYGEYIAGTDPADPASTFSIRDLLNGASEAPDTITLRWPSAEGRVYSILHTPNLSTPFATLIGDIPATPPSNSHAIPRSATRGFFKIGVSLP